MVIIKHVTCNVTLPRALQKDFIILKNKIRTFK
jgi:hypothetical protein